jgi:aminopeptidase N
MKNPELPAGAALRRPAAALLVAVFALALTAPAGLAAERRPFAPADQPLQYAPDRQYDLQHVRLELDFDWEGRRVAGTATNTVVPLLPGLRHALFHAVGLDIARVRLSGDGAGDAAGTEGGRELPFTVDPAARSVTVDLGRDYGPEDRLEIAFDYSAHPRGGLYFMGPDAAYPDKPKQIYSQGETELNRHWFPTWDYPNDRATTELIATVEPPFQVIGNGRLVEVADRPDGRRAYHWLMEQPHVTYLVSVVVGEFVKETDTWNGIPIEYYVPPSMADKTRRSFGNTPDMMEYFSTVTGRPYPYAKYAQTAVIDYMWGGMENITATTQTARTLHDERAALDTSSLGLVAHELAHQWFGDLVTCESWADIWLNEGFADYFDTLYRGHADGPDEFALEIDAMTQGYLAEDSTEYRRPIVTRRYVDPAAMFDSHSYGKGALVLHMVRYHLGEEGWWKGIREYLKRLENQTATTSDLQGVLEEVTGVSLGPLFDGYVRGAGHPELKLRWEHLPPSGTTPGQLRLTVEQAQELTAETGLFSFPLDVALVGEGETAVHRVAVRPLRLQEIVLPAPSRPRTVVVDPEGWTLKTVDFDKPVGEWIVQLEAAGHFHGHFHTKAEAVRALGEAAGMDAGRAVEALARALRDDPFRGVRQEAAKALGEVGTAAALAALQAGADDSDSRVRTAVFEAFAEFPRHPELVPTLRRALENDRSYYARAAAAKALGAFEGSRAEVVPALEKALSQESHVDVVRGAALKALAEIGAPRAYETALRYARRGSPIFSRDDALDALASLGSKTSDPRLRERIRRDLEGFLSEDDYNFRGDLYEAFSALGDPDAIPALERAAREEPEPRQRLRAQTAIADIRQKSAGKEPRELQKRIEDLETEVETLRKGIDERKGDVEGPGG